MVSYWAGIPGGIFSPALAVGAGLGHNIAYFLPSIPAGTVVLLGMSAYLSGVTGAPLTSAVIAHGADRQPGHGDPDHGRLPAGARRASLFCPTPVYKAMADILILQYQEEQARRDPPPQDEATHA